MMKIKFKEVKLKRKVGVECRTCGKKLQRTFSAMQTINPYNKNDLGIPKSAAQVHDSVRVELAALVEATKRDGVICRKCEV